MEGARAFPETLQPPCPGMILEIGEVPGPATAMDCLSPIQGSRGHANSCEKPLNSCRGSLGAYTVPRKP